MAATVVETKAFRIDTDATTHLIFRTLSIKHNLSHPEVFRLLVRIYGGDLEKTLVKGRNKIVKKYL